MNLVSAEGVEKINIPKASGTKTRTRTQIQILFPFSFRHWRCCRCRRRCCLTTTTMTTLPDNRLSCFPAGWRPSWRPPLAWRLIQNSGRDFLPKSVVVAGKQLQLQLQRRRRRRRLPPRLRQTNHRLFVVDGHLTEYRCYTFNRLPVRC